MTQTHKEQQVSALQASLLDAGIGRSYHRRSLKEVDEELFEIISTTIRFNALEGRGLYFEGSDAHQIDRAVLTARALHLQAVPSRVVYLPQLISWLHHDTAEVGEVESVQALFVLNFQEDGERICTRWQASQVETLIHHRLDEGRAFFAQGARIGSGWWSESLVDRVSRVTTVV